MGGTGGTPYALPLAPLTSFPGCVRRLATVVFQNSRDLSSRASLRVMICCASLGATRGTAQERIEGILNNSARTRADRAHHRVERLLDDVPRTLRSFRTTSP